MSPGPIREGFNVIKGAAPGLCSCLKGLAINVYYRYFVDFRFFLDLEQPISIFLVEWIQVSSAISV
jgi:hypothetical protein